MGKYLGTLIVLALMALTTGCGEEAYTANSIASDTDAAITDDPTVAPPPVPVGSVSLIAIPGASLGSSSSDSIELQATIKDTNNVVMSGIPVVFQTTGGTLTVNSGTSSATGVVSATLTSAGDPTNRDITVTATATTVSGTARVTVSGSTVSVSGANSLVFGDSTVLTIFVKDSAGNGIATQPVSVISASGNTLSAASVDTSDSGQAQVTVTGAVGGNDTITVTALNAAAQLSINVSSDQFGFTAPPVSPDLDIGANHTVTLSWTINGAAVADGTTVNFTATRGTLSTTSATTAGGVATVTISSNNAGPVDITASVSGGPTATISREFVATTPSSLVLQADKTTIGTDGKQAALTAIVRDASNNLVKSQTVRFNIYEDTTGGSISNSTDVSDSQGRSTTIYTSTSTTSAKDGITIQAGLDGQDCGAPPTTNALCDEINLTVAQSELFVVLGTGNKIFIEDETRYRYPYTVVVTDAAGNAVPNKDVVINLVPTYYRTGYLIWSEEFSINFVITTASCQNEDLNLNGFIDAVPTPEDLNQNGDLDPRNVASVSGTVTTDTNGFAKIDIIYAKEYANWVSVQLTATTGVDGSESLDTVYLGLPAEAGEMNSRDNPPAFFSPWGPASTCYNAKSVVPYNVIAIPSDAISDQATPPSYTGDITVDWTSLPGATSYNVYRSQDPIALSGTGVPLDGNGAPLAAIPAPASTYDHKGLGTDEKWYYRVTAIFPAGYLNTNDRNVNEGLAGAGEGPASAEAFATTAAVPTP